MSEQQCLLKVFNLDSESLQKHKLGFEVCNGYRFDSIGHNFLLHIDHLSLAFSYMSFVMSETKNNPDNIFDPE